MSVTKRIRQWALAYFSEANFEGAIVREIADDIDEVLAERYIALPIDAEGEPIHVGDVLNPPAGCDDYMPLQVVRLTYDGYEAEWYFDGDAGGFTGMVGERMDVAGWTHYRQPTVEDVLVEFHERMDELGTTDQCVGIDKADAVDALLRERAELVAEYIAKLQLKEE